jgi:hypothetical protein
MIVILKIIKTGRYSKRTKEGAGFLYQLGILEKLFKK